ncbi:hypothetical protein Sste5346_001778 [Sporothrix stenoceras]|uniref:Uncharacterized protein n=1 Tax=Sporothrix stenoceras TaxID=5173 RepID=A0ABR3ZKW7_9PEZI
MNNNNFHQYPHSPPPSYSWQQSAPFASPTYGAIGTSFNSYGNGETGRNGHGSFASNEDNNTRHSTHQPLAGSPSGPTNSGGDATAASMPRQSSFSPIDPMDDFNDISPRLSDVSIDSNHDRSTPPSSLSASSAQDRVHNGFDSSSFRNGSIATNGTGSSGATIVPGMAGGLPLASRSDGRPRTSRRGVNRDEFDGPHQFLPRPTQQYIAMQERELPHLPTNLLVQEQDSVLSQVNDRLSQCAFDFVARYQFPVPLTQDMRPVARPQDREWTEWVQLLKRLATKRRIPARVLYNGQIKQFVTILENSLEMRHAARHQSRPLKDDRNILQLISAGIQVAKILKDAPAMSFLDQLYIATDQQIQDRSASAAARFRG